MAAWYPDGTTFHVRNNPDPKNPNYIKDYIIRDRHEFVGRLINTDDHMAKLYLGKSVKRYLRASGSAIHYSYNSKGDLYKFDSQNKVINP